ncbi:MAG: signal peptide peptidase SppA [Planctomycetia bacterium]|nr:signal peptide peptidase SppA [Planctomycetia bacterium]
MSTDHPQSGSSLPPRPNPGYVPATIAGPAPTTRIVLEQPGGGLRKIFMSLLITGLIISVLFNFGLFNAYHSYFQDETGIQEKYHSGSKLATDKIAIITLKGVIMEGDGFVKKQIDRISEDKSVKAVVLRVDSPGGTVTGSDYIYYHLNKLRVDKKIPVVVSMGSLAASGGYYVSMAVGDGKDTIFAEPATWTGSIGVIIPHYDVSSLLKDWKVADDSISSKPLKQMLSPTRPPSEEAQKVVRVLVDESYARFKEVVASGRPALRDDAKLMDAATTGQIFSAQQALKLHLIDKTGYLDDAIQRAADLAGTKVDDVRVVDYHQPQSLKDALWGGSQSSESASQLSMLLDMTAPRAYFLCTWLPAVWNSQR